MNAHNYPGGPASAIGGEFVNALYKEEHSVVEDILQSARVTSDGTEEKYDAEKLRPIILGHGEESWSGTALHMACKKGNIGVLSLLLPFSDPHIINMKDSRGNTALMYSCDDADLRAMRLLLDAEGVNVNLKEFVSRSTALHRAVEKRNFEAVKMLTKHPGVNLNAVNGRGESPLVTACEGYHLDRIIKLLLGIPEVRIDIVNPEDPYPLIHLVSNVAARQYFPLLMRREDVEVNTVLYDHYPVMYACTRDECGIVRTLSSGWLSGKGSGRRGCRRRGRRFVWLVGRTKKLMQ